MPEIAPTQSHAPVAKDAASRRFWLRCLAIGVGVSVLVALLGYYFIFSRTEPAKSKLVHKLEPETEKSVPTGPPIFRDMTSDSGLDFTYRNGEEADLYTILESLGGGVAMTDYDGDGLLDLFFTGGGSIESRQIKGHPCRLFKNLGNWRFRDVTAEVGLDKVDFYTHGAAVADYDCDGWPDLLVTGYGRLALFRNEQRDGKRVFVEVTKEAGLEDKLWSTSAGFADLTGSGYPDLYVCHYVDWSLDNNRHCAGRTGVGKRDVCSPLVFKPQPHALFLNQKNGTFRRAPAETLRDGNGLGVLLADLNDDGRPDIFVANDLTEKFLYMNRGQGKLEEVGTRAGVARDANGYANGSMGVDAADFDGSGRPSLWVTNFQGENHNLLQNLGKEGFTNNSHGSGVAALGQQFVAFGTAFLDFDNDGWEDLVIANGHVLRNPAGSPCKQLAVLLHNTKYEGRRFFKNVSPQGGSYFQTPTMGRGLAVGDLDNDGWPDVVISHTGSRAALLRNERTAGTSQRWLGIKLVGRKHRDLVGTTLRLDDGTRILTRFVKGGGSYLSAGDSRILFGLGSAGVCRKLSVRWSWGETQHWTNLECNGYWELHEGEAEARKLNYPNSK